MSAFQQSASAAGSIGAAAAPRRAGIPSRLRALATRAPRPELLALGALAATLNLWALSRNGWANEYYSAAVRSMASSWHDFLFASLDRSGVMTVDKPPLSLWVQALSVRVFGYHQLTVLVPQALMGVASVVLVYDLVRRRFGRAGGFVAGLALALTPITVAVSRHNNPDALLVLCSVAALWSAVRAMDAGPTDPRTRWLVLSGVCVGLGFETKMGVALTVVPGIAVAWMWMAPAARTPKGAGGRLHALRQLLAGGAAMVLVGGAWPALVELTPAADRPWVSGTSDNSVLSLIFGYNGLGRVEGQTGSPGGGGGMFGSSPGPLRLLNSALGGQAGWLLGLAVVAGLAMLVSCRLRRSDPRSGWLLAVGGAFVTTAALFSAASGIFHPYYVSLLAPFTAALVGAGAAQLISRRRTARIVGPLAILAGVAVELYVRGHYTGQLTWLPPALIVSGVLAAAALALASSRRVRVVAVAAMLGALLLAPGVWAIDTLGYATSGTFPAGGPANVSQDTGGPPGGFGAFAVLRRIHALGAGGLQLFGPAGGQRGGPSGGPGGGPRGLGGLAGGQGGVPGGGPRGVGVPGGGLRGVGGPGGLGGEGSIDQALVYIKSHGGGTLAVASQSSASSAIVSSGARVAGIGGFSGRESSVSVSWLVAAVRSGKIRWVQGENQRGGGNFPRLPGDTRVGSRTALAAVAKACRAVTLPASGADGAGTRAGEGASGGTRRASSGTLYDCQGRSAELEALAR